MNAFDISHWLNLKPYELNAQVKNEILAPALIQLTKFHFDKCQKYRRILISQGIDPNNLKHIQDVPFIPVRLFKEFDLFSVPEDSIFKKMTSSGTSGQSVSRIYLDRHTSASQTKVLSRIMTHILGDKRLPMLIIDSPGAVKDRHDFSARGAGILGFSMFGQDVTYALTDSMDLDFKEIAAFLARRQPRNPIFIFGFTFMIWRYFVLALQERGICLPLENGILLHGGGWKRLQDQAVDNQVFKATLKEVAGINHVVNYYGMVEQTGSLFMECEAGFLHAPVYSDVIIRRMSDLSIAPVGEEGVIEVLSMLPQSYPGHALLTEDLGIVYGEDNCACGRLGKWFQVRGRVAKAEIRGCSDTHEIRS